MSGQRGRLLSGGALSFATVLTEKAASLGVVLLLARLLPADVYGEYAFIIAFLGIFQILAEAGIETVLVRRLVLTPERREFWVRAALGLRLSAALVSSLLAMAIVGVASGGTVASSSVAAAAGLLLAAQPVARATLRIEGGFGAVFFAAMVAALVGMAAQLLAAAASLPLVFVLGGASLGPLVGLALGLALVARRQRVAPRFDVPAFGALLRDSWPVAANLLVIVLSLRAAPLLLMRFEGPVTVGLFTSAARLVEATNLIAEAAMLLLYPALARSLAARHDVDSEGRDGGSAQRDGGSAQRDGGSAQRDGGSAQRDGGSELAQLAARALSVALLALALLVAPAGGPLMRLLFGEAFAVAGQTLSLLIWTAPLSALGTLYVGLLVAVGKQRVLFGLNLFSAALQLGLQWFLVRHYGGHGAAVGIVVAALLNHAVLAALPVTRPWILPCLGAALRPGLLAAAAFAAWRLSGVGPGILPGLLVSAAFCLGCVASGTLAPRHLQRAQELLRFPPESPVC